MEEDRVIKKPFLIKTKLNGCSTKVHFNQVYRQKAWPWESDASNYWKRGRNFTPKEDRELLQSVWRLKIDTTGNAGLIASGSSLLGTPEYKILCK